MTPEHKALVDRANEHIAMAKNMGNFGVASKLVAELASALSAQCAQPQAGEAVAVKPLEWWTASTGDIISDSLVGRYRLGKITANENYRLETPSGLMEKPSPDYYWPEQEAKAAAQADYERRIFSALSQPHSADERVVEALATVEEWQKWALTWAGSAFLSGETISPDDMTEAEHKSELYSGMCKLSNHMEWLRDEIAALAQEGRNG